MSKLSREQGKEIAAKLTQLFEAEDFVCIVTDDNKRSNSVHVFNRVKTIRGMDALREAVLRWREEGTSGER